MYTKSILSATLLGKHQYPAPFSSSLPCLTRLIAAFASAQTVQYTGNGIVVTVNVPADTASSKSGPIYLQLAAPSGTEWLGIGQGSQMAGANMFVMYAESSSNVTVSPRSGTGHVEPQFNSGAQVTVLEGTGITGDGSLVANLRCDSCLSWSGGSMDPTDANSNWIWAIKQGSPLDSSSTSADISQHDTMGNFNLNLPVGTGGSSSNPFIQQVSSSTAAAGGSQTTATQSPGATQSSVSGSTTTSNPSVASPTVPAFAPSGVSSGDGSNSSSSTVDTTRAAHAAIMAAVFLVFFPLSALTLYLPTANRVRYVHAPLQAISIILMIVGLAIGVKLGKSVEELDGYHQIIGYVLVAVLIGGQPALGIYQHLYYHRTGGHSPLGTVHKWMGRVAILVGAVNGGLGFMQSGPVGSEYVPNYSVVVYSIVAVVVFFIYILVVVMTKWRSSRNNPTDEKLGGRAGYEMHPSSFERPYISSPQNYPAGQQQQQQQQQYGRQSYR